MLNEVKHLGCAHVDVHEIAGRVSALPRAVNANICNVLCGFFRKDISCFGWRWLHC